MPKEFYRIVIQVFVNSAFTTEQKTRLLNRELLWPIGGAAKMAFSDDQKFVQFHGATRHYSSDTDKKILQGLLEFSQSLGTLGLVVNKTRYEIYDVISSHHSQRDDSPKRK